MRGVAEQCRGSNAAVARVGPRAASVMVHSGMRIQDGDIDAPHKLQNPIIGDHLLRNTADHGSSSPVQVAKLVLRKQ